MKINTERKNKVRGVIAAFAVLGLTMTACSSNSSQSSPPAPTSTGITSGILQFGLVQPNSGTQPVVDFFNSAKNSTRPSVHWLTP